MEIKFSKASARTLRRMPANTSALILSKIEAHANDPDDQANNVKKLKGRDGYRLGVGDWRVIFDRQGRVLAILRIMPRGGAYE